MAGIPAHHVERARLRFEGETLPPARLAAKRNLQAEATDSPKTCSKCGFRDASRCRRPLVFGEQHLPDGRVGKRCEALDLGAERREPSRNLFGLFELVLAVVVAPAEGRDPALAFEGTKLEWRQRQRGICAMRSCSTSAAMKSADSAAPAGPQEKARLRGHGPQPDFSRRTPLNGLADGVFF